MLYIQRLISTLSSLFLAILISTVTSMASATTITVDSTADFADADGSNFDNYTCTYTSGAFFFPAPDGLCTLRRATVEAAVRPDNERPITIDFNIPTNDPNYDSTLMIWEVQIDSHPTSASSAGSEWIIDRRYISSDGGQITIDGGIRPDGNGPEIMINTNSNNGPFGGGSLEVFTSNNTLVNLGFHGGGQIILYEANNLVENVWMGLTNDGKKMKLASTATSQAKRAMARGGIIMPNADSDNNIIRNNVVIGAFERAIRVTDSDGDGNIIKGNYIGTNSAGEIEGIGVLDQVDCTRDSDYDPNLWYGGRGIQVNGSHTLIQNNTIVGLHVTQTANETPPISMEIYGTDNIITGNIIGKTSQDQKAGVCGQGLQLGGTESIVTDNSFYFTRNGFNPNDIDTESDNVIFTQSYLTQNNGDPARWLKVFNNIIDGDDNTEANFHAYRFATGVNLEMRQFVPAKVTSISGKTIRGTNGNKLFNLSVDPFCPKCEVFLYADDVDNRIESSELLGSTFADHKGDWVATLSRTLVAGEGLRTQSMSRKNDTMISDSTTFPIKYYAANNTTRLSDVLYNNINASSLSQNEILTRRDMAREILKTLSINPPITATGMPYGDVNQTDIHANWIEEFKTRGYTEGCTTNKFCPEKAVTREEIAKVILKAKNAFNSAYTPTASSGVFTDVPNGAFNEYWINELSNISWTTGCAANKFCPKGLVTRQWFEQLLTLVTPTPFACSTNSDCSGLGNETCTTSNVCGL